jgi:hypothetical protein
MSLSLLVNETCLIIDFMPVTLHCVRCTISEEERRMFKCPICFNKVCETCCYFFAGRHFCSKGCADYFFFGSGDDDDED